MRIQGQGGRWHWISPDGLLRSTTIGPVDPPEDVDAPKGTRISADDLLAVLNGLPGPWFDQLVFKFDSNNAVSAKPAAQSVRAMELIAVLRVTDSTFVNVLAEIDRLKGTDR